MKKILVVAVLLTAMLLLAACNRGGETTPSEEGNQPAQNNQEATTPAQNNQETTPPDETTQAGTDELEPVELIIYFIGDGAPDNDDVFAVLNARTSELINTTIRPLFISWADFGTRYPLVFASGEYFDMIFTAPWSYYVEQALRGGFYPLSMEMLNTYAPGLMAKMPDAAMRQARIGGTVYMVPNIQYEFGHLGLMIRGDLRRAHDIPEITSLDIFKDYLRAIANEPGIIPFDTGSEIDIWTIQELFLLTPNGWAYPSGDTPLYTYRLDDPTATLFNMSETQEWHDFMDLMVEFNELGMWRMDALTNPNSSIDNFLAGRSGTGIHNMGTVASAWQEAMTHFPEWEVEVVDATFGGPTVMNSFISNGMGIRAISQHPERSLMWLNLIRTNQELYDLMMYGIEGRHWINEGPGAQSMGPDHGNYGGFSNWGFVTQTMRRLSVDEHPNLRTIEESRIARAIDAPARHFLFDGSELANETAAMNNLRLQYHYMLYLGFDADWEDTVASLNIRYDSLGRQDIVAEFRDQLAAFLYEYTR